MNQGNLDSAFRRADDAYQYYVSRDPAWAWRFRVQKAHILIRRGSLDEALKLLKEEIPQSLAGTDVTVRAKLARALALQYLQRFDLADKELQEAAQLVAAVSPDLAGDLDLQRGMLEVDRKNYDQAAVAFHSALSESRRQNLPLYESSALANLGYLAMWQEHYDQAIDWFKLAIEKSRQSGAQIALAKTIGNLGWNYSVVGDFDSAVETFKQAVDFSAKTGLSADHVYWLNALGNVYYQQHRYQEAAAASRQALALAREMDNQRTLTECLNTLSEIELATGDLDLAEKHNLEAGAIEESGRDHLGIQYSQLISGRIAAAKKQFPEAEAIFQKILADPSVETPLKWQAESRLAQVYAAQNQPAKAEAEFQSAIATIREAQSGLQREEFRVSFLAGAIQFYEAYIDFLVSRGRTLDALSIADLSRARALTRGLSERTKSPKASFVLPDPKKLAARFRSTLLFYSLGERYSYLWLITPAKVTLLSLPPEQEIRRLVTTYRQAILNSPADPLASTDSPGAKLYSLLVAPAARFIPRNSRVIILSDGALDTFNFETLVVRAPQPHYWIEDVIISNANSLALLARSNSIPAPHNPNLLLVGNAVSSDPSFPPLPQASAEISRVESYFPEKSRFLLTGAAATPAAYLQSDPARYTYLHFVTHGIASRLQPLESAVVLSPSGDSHKLYAREIITRPLRAYLVTISACNGAGNRAYAGEGLVGLSWAFLRAGARNVISALWEVSDASTPQLMNSLYEGLHRGEDPATALRNAKLGLLRSNTIYKKPFYWAPFQLYSGS